MKCKDGVGGLVVVLCCEVGQKKKRLLKQCGEAEVVGWGGGMAARRIGVGGE
jgi:hypothetical protein